MPSLFMNSRGIIVAVFLTVYFSKLIWYDLRTIFPSQASAILSVSFMWYSAILIPFILFFLIKEFKIIFRSSVISIFFALNLFGMVVGLLKGNANMFFLQDTFKFLFFPAGFAAAIYYNSSEKFNGFDSILYKIYWMLVVFSFIRFMLHYSLGDDLSFLYGTVHDIYLISMSIGMIWKQPFGVVVAMIVIFLVLFGNKRTLFVLFLLNLGLSSVLFMRNMSAIVWLRRFFLVLLCAVVVSVFVSKLESSAYKRVLNTSQTYETDIGTSSKRLREVTVAYDLMRKDAPLSFLIGFGSGAFFHDPVPNARTGESITHSIHFTPMAFFYRYGIIGLCFLGIVYSSFIRISFMFKFSNDRVIDYSIKATILGSIVMSFLVYSFLDDIFLGFIYGMFFIRSNYRISNVYCKDILIFKCSSNYSLNRPISG